MDNIDMKILNCLKKNARLTASSISDEINLSVSAVIERIKKLENSGIIKGYTIDLDQEKMGNTMVALMGVSLKHPDYYDEFVKLVNDNNSIAACYYQTGDSDFVLKIVTDSSDGLDKVYREVKGFEGVANTDTHYVLKTIKEDSAIIPNIEK